MGNKCCTNNDENNENLVLNTINEWEQYKIYNNPETLANHVTFHKKCKLMSVHTSKPPGKIRADKSAEIVESLNIPIEDRKGILQFINDKSSVDENLVKRKDSFCRAKSMSPNNEKIYTQGSENKKDAGFFPLKLPDISQDRISNNENLQG